MISKLLPFIFYALDSICFLVGTLIVIVREIKS